MAWTERLKEDPNLKQVLVEGLRRLPFDNRLGFVDPYAVDTIETLVDYLETADFLDADRVTALLGALGIFNVVIFREDEESFVVSFRPLPEALQGLN